MSKPKPPKASKASTKPPPAVKLAGVATKSKMLPAMKSIMTKKAAGSQSLPGKGSSRQPPPSKAPSAKATASPKSHRSS